MSLTLSIDTSIFPYCVMLAQEEQIIFNSQNHSLTKNVKEVEVLVQEGLKEISHSLSDVKRILVNIGPGGTSSIRTGVAFANSLAFSRNIPVFAVNAFELVGIELWQQFKLPVVFTAKSIRGHAYCGLFNNGETIQLKYGLFEEVIKELVQGLSQFVVAGFHKECIIELFPEKDVIDCGLLTGSAQTLLEMGDAFFDRNAQRNPFVYPLTEQSKVFYE